MRIQSQKFLQPGRQGRDRLIGGDTGADKNLDPGAVKIRVIPKTVFRGGTSQIQSRLLIHPVAGQDAGAFADPFIGGIKIGGKIVVINHAAAHRLAATDQRQFHRSSSFHFKLEVKLAGPSRESNDRVSKKMIRPTSEVSRSEVIRLPNQGDSA